MPLTANCVMCCTLQVGFTREGRLVALDLNLYCNAGNSLDLRCAVQLGCLAEC